MNFGSEIRRTTCQRPPAALGRARFPWYDFPFVHDDYRALWSALARILSEFGMTGLPARLDEGDLDELLRSPELLVSQTCGYDIAIGRPAPLTVVATPSFTAPGCGRGTYVSLIVVHARSNARGLADLAGRRFVANDARSWSGYHCIRDHHARFAACEFRGGHLESVRAVADGLADVAAIDVVSWTLIARHRPELVADLRVIGTTDPAPAPPLVTAARRAPAHVAVLRRALSAVLRREPALCRHLLIADFVDLGEGAYDFMRDSR